LVQGELRLRGMSPVQIGAAHGRRRGQITYRALGLLTYATHAGIRSGQTSRVQANEFLRTQRRGLHHWLDSRIHKPGAGADLQPKSADHIALLCFPRRGDTG
jgi:hypothetical protein